MFPEETHQKIVKQIDDVEADLFRLYRRLARLRMDLQRDWRVLPSGDRWTREAQDKCELGQ